MKKIIFAGVMCMCVTAFAAGCSGAKESSKTDGSGAVAASGGSSVYYVKNEDSQAVGFSGFTKENSTISSDADLEAQVSGNESISSYTSNVNRNVYAEPDTNSTVIGRIECNDVVYIVDGYDSNDWYLLSYNGRAAYVPAAGDDPDEDVYELFSPYYSDDYSYYDDGPYGGNEWQEYYGDWDDFYYGGDEGYDDGSDGGSSDEPDDAGDEASDGGQETTAAGSDADTEADSADDGAGSGAAGGNVDADGETEPAGGEN